MRACSILSQEHPTLLVRYGFALAQAVRVDLSERLAATGMRGMEVLPRMVQTGRLGEVMFRIEQHLLPILGLDSVEYMKGVFNRFPMGARRDDGTSIGKIQFEPVHSLSGLRAAAAQVEGILEQILMLREKMLDETQSTVEYVSELERPRVQ